MSNNSGKITLLAIATGLLAFSLVTVLDPFKYTDQTPFWVYADTATTTVTVLNTPPLWVTNAYEFDASTTTSPWNVDSAYRWVGLAHDDNAEGYYLLICKTSSTPTPNSNAAPTCGGGAGNQWAVSTSTASDVQATSTRIVTSTDPETNEWFAWICDFNPGTPRCNSTFTQGIGGSTTNTSPWYANHRPYFTLAADDTPANPGALVTWTTNASDTDAVGGQDEVQLFVCRANDFTGTACGAGGTYCTSTAVVSNPTCGYTVSSTLPDGTYNAFGFIIDNHILSAYTSPSSSQATNTVITINNVAPSISSSSIDIQDALSATSSLILTVHQGETTGFKVKFTVTDQNSCQTQAAGDEIVSTTVSVYRSGIGQSGCVASSSYNPNNCYPYQVATTSWNRTCTRDGGTCSGQSDPNEDWTCTFPFWYVADPTDGSNATDTVFFAQNWLASVIAQDNNNATSGLVEAQTGEEMLSFLAYSLLTSSINFGSLSPGSSTDPLVSTTTVRARGNVGLDHTLYGDSMCTTYPSCTASVTSSIAIQNQKFATSSVGYASSSAFTATSTPGTELEINIRKTIQTSTPATGTTFWGIQIPVTITLSGDYTGMNTIIGIKGEAQDW